MRRRYERALKGRRVVGKRNPDGTATLTGHDLPFDEVAAACARLDALAHAAKTAGHPDRLDHLRADLLVGMITGRYTAMTDQQILAALLTEAEHRTANPHHTNRTGDDDDGDDASGTNPDDDGPDDDGPGDDGLGDDDPDDASADDGPNDRPDEVGLDEGSDEGFDDGGSDGGGQGEGVDADAPAGVRGDPTGAGSDGADRHESDRGPPGPSRPGLGRRGGLRLSLGLLTVMGGDQRPGELLGWGPVHAELACDLALSLPSWWCVLTDEGGAPLAVVPIRRRPRHPATDHGRQRAGGSGECWLERHRRHAQVPQHAWTTSECSSRAGRGCSPRSPPASQNAADRSAQRRPHRPAAWGGAAPLDPHP